MEGGGEGGREGGREEGREGEREGVCVRESEVNVWCVLEEAAHI